MDAYDIPDELSNLQSQDMSKVGFIQDILRGVKKILDASKSGEKTPSTATGAVTASPGIESLMKRGKLFLEDSDWKQANEYFDKVLDIDPEYAPAYVGKLCAELKVRNEELLEDNKNPISELSNFQKAVRFTNAEYQAKLKGYDKKIRERIRQGNYNSLIQEKNNASTEEEYLNLAKKFREMNGYENTVELAKECDNSAVQARFSQLVQAMNRASTEDEYHNLAQKFREMNGYKNSTELASECGNQYRLLKERREEQDRIERERREKEEKKEEKKRKKRNLVKALAVIIEIWAIISVYPAINSTYKDSSDPGSIILSVLIASIGIALFCRIFFTDQSKGIISMFIILVYSIVIIASIGYGRPNTIYWFISNGLGAIVAAILAYVYKFI